MIYKIKKISYFIVGLFIAAGLRVNAAEMDDSIMGTLQQIIADTEVKEEADEESATVGTLQAGTAVIIMDMEDLWYKVLYQNIEGYIPGNVLQNYEAGDESSLNEEFQSVADDEQRLVDENELIQNNKQNFLIWRIVIAVLIIGIFGASIGSVNKKRKDEYEEKTEATYRQGL